MFSYVCVLQVVVASASDSGSALTRGPKEADRDNNSLLLIRFLERSGWSISAITSLWSRDGRHLRP